MFGFGRHKRYATERDLHALAHTVMELTTHVLRKDREVANDLTKLKDAVAKLETTVGSLPPPEPDKQPEIDDLTARVDALNTKLTPPTPTP